MFEKITLEMSLKPFKKTDSEYLKKVIERVYEQWSPLVSEAEEISVLLWVSDGSEILEYRGNPDDEFEWCRYVGGANRLKDKSKLDPEGIGLHTRAYFYMDDPPTFTYGKLKEIVSLIKEIGRERYPQKRIRVGATFDPGPEFAISKFKYETHNEICLGSTIGSNSFVCCYTTLHKDETPYAGFPNGIEEGLPLATFLGRQSQCFLSELDFDYLWLSNGFGFGLEPWSTTGATFDGEHFFPEKLEEARAKILEFWKLFRKECDFRIEVRGTNLTVGIDSATDGVPLKDIYSGNFDILPPPNSPWAALDGNFGIELCGYLSRISHLPKEEYLFRYYVHDPWWANTPWTDRYDSLPHDIYLPLSLCRLDERAKAKLPSNLAILSIDNSFGEMPDFCAYEPSVHLNRAKRYAPDAPSPVVWVYPFDEYNDFKGEDSMRRAFSGDWFMSETVNRGLPLGSVITTKNLVSALKDDPSALKGSILVSTVPIPDSDYEQAVFDFISRRGKVIFYGNARGASERFLTLIGVKLCEDDLYGELEVEKNEELDLTRTAKRSYITNVRPSTTSGGINTVLRENSEARELLRIGGRTAATHNGSVTWFTAVCSQSYVEGKRLLVPDRDSRYFTGESVMRYLLDVLGMKIRFEKETPDSPDPMITASRHEGAFMIAASAKDTSVKTRIKFPLGAPIPSGRETRIDEEGFGEYHFTKSEFLECRIFVEQEGGVVSCHDLSPGSFFRSRKIKLDGLKNATVRFFAPEYCKEKIEALFNSDDLYTFVSEDFDGGYVTDENGTYFEARGITGKMYFAIPFKKLHASTRKVKNNVPKIK